MIVSSKAKRYASSAMVLAAVVAAAADAHGDAPMHGLTKQECVAASEHGQELRRSGKLRDARTQFAICVATSCPGVVREDCAQRLSEVDAAMPTLVLDVRDPSGNDVTEGQVELDGENVLDHLSGTAFAVDPGPHRLRIDVPGFAKIEKSIVIREGDKSRLERIQLANVPGASAGPEPGSLPSRPAENASGAPRPTSTEAKAPTTETAQGGATPTGTGQRVIGVVVGGVGIAGIALGSAFGLMANSLKAKIQSECTPSNCPSQQHDQAVTDRNTASAEAAISTVSFAAGGALLATGVILFLLAPSPAKEGHNAPVVRVVPYADSHGAGLWLADEF